MLTGSLEPEIVEAQAVRRRRFAYGLTPRAVALLCVGFLWLYPGYFFPWISWGFAIWVGLILLLAVLDGFALPDSRLLKLKRRWLSAPSLDSEAEIELSVENESSRILDCRLIDDLPLELVANAATHRLFAFPGVAATVRYTMRPSERGDFEAGDVFVRYRTGVGLTERWAKAELKQNVRVYPALRSAEEENLFLSRSKQIDLQLRQVKQRGLGREFDSLREYRIGDDLRDICWTASARRGGLITRQYQTERSQPVWIVIDCGRLMRARVGLSSAAQQLAGKKLAKTPIAEHDASELHTKLDHACSAAVALAQLALYSGDRVGLLAYGREIQQRVLPGRGAAHLRQLIESLAQLKAEPVEADHLRATATLNRLQPRRSLILWVTDLAESAMRPEVIDGAMQLLKRHVLLFVAMAQPEVERIATERPESVERMFRAAAAQEMASRREHLLAQLFEHGARTLDLNPEQLTTQILNQYLEIKERALI